MNIFGLCHYATMLSLHVLLFPHDLYMKPAEQNSMQTHSNLRMIPKALNYGLESHLSHEMLAQLQDLSEVRIGHT